jgi:hypothetical protein
MRRIHGLDNELQVINPQHSTDRFSVCYMLAFSGDPESMVGYREFEYFAIHVLGHVHTARDLRHA